MSVFDIIILILLVISAIIGFRKGLIMQIFGLLAIFLGVYCAFKFSGLIANLLSKNFEIDGVALSATSFIITMIIVWIGVILLGKMLNSIFKLTALGLFNRLFGIVFACAQTLLIISAVLYAFSFLEISKNESVNNELSKSRLYAPLKRIAEAAFPYINFDKFAKNE